MEENKCEVIKANGCTVCIVRDSYLYIRTVRVCLLAAYVRASILFSIRAVEMKFISLSPSANEQERGGGNCYLFFLSLSPTFRTLLPYSTKTRKEKLFENVAGNTLRTFFLCTTTHTYTYLVMVQYE